MRILVVDNQPEMLESLVKVLSSAQGIDGAPYKVTPEQSHEKALDILKQERFEVVVNADGGESDNEGLEAIGAMRIVHALMDKSPITIVLASSPSLPNCVAAIRAGAWDYLEKKPHDGSEFYDNLLRSIKEGCQHRLAQPDLGRPDPNARWVHENLKCLMQQYPEQVVAILDERVLEHGPTYGEVLDRLEGKFFLTRPYLFLVPDPTLEMIE